MPNEVRNWVRSRATIESLEKNNHTNTSKPSAWFETLLPLKQSPSDPVSLVTINDWTTLTNKKAMLANAGVWWSLL
jgi:hypothetical protein